MKLTMAVILILLLGLVFGCSLFEKDTLTLSGPEFGYPGDAITVRADGVLGAHQYTYEVEGQTLTQGATLTFVVHDLPCVVTVTSFSGGIPYEATHTIYLQNEGPRIGNPVLNGDVGLWVIFPKTRYTVTFPYAYDPEGGPLTLVNVTVFHTGQQAYQAVFCPPYAGPPAIEQMLYRVRTGQGDIPNAFVFHSAWEEFLDTETYGWVLPVPPPSKSEEGYPGGRGATCPPLWPRETIPGGVTRITATFEDEMGARTTETSEIPTMYYPGC